MVIFGLNFGWLKLGNFLLLTHCLSYSWCTVATLTYYLVFVVCFFKVICLLITVYMTYAWFIQVMLLIWYLCSLIQLVKRCANAHSHWLRSWMTNMQSEWDSIWAKLTRPAMKLTDRLLCFLHNVCSFTTFVEQAWTILLTLLQAGAPPPHTFFGGLIIPVVVLYILQVCDVLF